MMRPTVMIAGTTKKGEQLVCGTRGMQIRLREAIQRFSAACAPHHVETAVEKRRKHHKPFNDTVGICSVWLPLPALILASICRDMIYFFSQKKLVESS